MSDVDELTGLTQRLQEAEATLEAIRDGRVDAVVVEGSGGQQVYTLESADLPYQQFLEQMSEGAVSLDGHGTVLFCNRFFAEAVGQPRERVLGSNFEALVPLEYRGSYRAALELDQVSRLGLRLAMPDGKRLPVQLAITPVGEGDNRRFTVVITDLSDRERFQELSLGREAAEAASLAKDQFLATVCHELRTPLNAVLGWAHMLLETKANFDAKTVRALEVIERNARMQAKLIEDLLDVSRVASGKLSIERAPVDLAELARVAVSSLLPQATAKGVALLLRTEGALYVDGDTQRLQQVLLNLLGNALKFTPSGGSVELTVAQVGERARIEVRDDGQGIDPDMLPRIFQLFRQGAEGSTRRGGLGLGLSITKHLVEMHEGNLSAHSAGLGHGAQFVIDLPALAREAVADRPRETVELATSLHGLRVLLVDDEEDTREVTARALRKTGAEVVAVSDAEAALARLDGDQFDMIVSDLMMPGTTGWDLARTVRTRYGTRVPLLAVTSLHGPEQVQKARAAGFDELVTKPLEEAGLARVRRRFFASARATLG